MASLRLDLSFSVDVHIFYVVRVRPTFLLGILGVPPFLLSEMWPTFKTERPFETLVSLQGDMRLSTLAFGFTVGTIASCCFWMVYVY